MIKIDHQLLVEIGLGHLETQQQQIIQRRIYEIMELRVGHLIGSSLTSAQRDIFEELIKNEPEAAEQYLEEVIPNYAVVVRSELDFVAESILNSVRQGAVVIGAGAEDG